MCNANILIAVLKYFWVRNNEFNVFGASRLFFMDNLSETARENNTQKE